MGGPPDAVPGLFSNHTIVRLDGEHAWGAVDANNRLTVLDGKDTLLKLIDSDPPRVTGDLELTKRYAVFIDEIENPDEQRIDTFESIVWKDALTPEEQAKIDAARTLTVEAPVATRQAENVSVTLWVASQKRLIVRLIKVQPDGHYSYWEIGRADDLPLVTTTAKKFRSLDAFRAYCGAPTMPIEQCRLCSKIPASASRHVEDDDVSDDRPAEMLQLQAFLDDGKGCEILRCPTCHRFYVNETHFGLGYFDYDSYWTRSDVDEIFNLEGCVAQRLPNHRVKSVKRADTPKHVKVQFEDSEGWSVLDTNNQLTPIEPVKQPDEERRDTALPVPVTPPPPPPPPPLLVGATVSNDRFFPKHVLVRFDSGAWAALDANNQLLMLEGRDSLVKLIESDPPLVDTLHVDVVMRYAFFVDAIEHPHDQRHEARPRLSRVEDPVHRTWDRKVIVRFWVTSGEQRILRVITVQPDGRYECRDGGVPRKIFESFDAFRACCGEPTMPLEQCPICSKTPESCAGTTPYDPPEIEPLVPFMGGVLPMPGVSSPLFVRVNQRWKRHLLGQRNELELGSIQPRSAFRFDLGVGYRLRDLDISWVEKDRFFPNHVLVRFGSRAWGALDHNNQLVVLDSHDAIVKLIDSDPPRVTEDLELAKRYALFIDEREYPEDDRPDFFENIRWTGRQSAEEKQRVDAAKAATGLAEATDPPGWHDMRATAERDGDRVVVRFWATPPQKQLIRRIITVLPNGQLIREDSVIAENLPIRDGSPYY